MGSYDKTIEEHPKEDKYIIDSGASINVFNSIAAIDGMVILAIEELPMNDTT